MKVALVRAKYSPFGGAERVLNSAVESLVTLGATPTIVTRSWPANASAGAGAGAAVAHRLVNPRYMTSAGRDRGFARAVCAELEQQHFDLVQSYERLPCCDVFHAVEGVHAEWLFQRRRIQSAVQRFGVAINPHHRYMLGVERRMFESPRLRAVICVSQMVKREISARFNVPDDRLSVIYGGIDCEYFHPGLRQLHRQPTRAQLGMPVDAPVALFVGSGFARKGVAAYLDTLARIDGLYGIVVGHDKHIHRYRRRAAQLGLEKRVRFTGGIKDVRPFYGASDIFLMPTVYEPFGLTFGEAMACGLPVVASNKAGAADWITEGVSGFVVDPAHVSALVSAVNQALARPEMGIAGRAAVMPYTPARITADYAAFYRGLLPR